MEVRSARIVPLVAALLVASTVPVVAGPGAIEDTDASPGAPEAASDRPAVTLSEDALLPDAKLGTDAHRQFLVPWVDGAGSTAELSVTTLDLPGPSRAAPVPLPVDGIGPGSYISTTMEGNGSTGCTANFVWEDPAGTLYLGTAGHCVMPQSSDPPHSTHGPDPDWDASKSHTRVRVEGCLAEVCPDGGRMVDLGPLVYARQCPVDHDHPCQIGYDLALVQIPEEHHDLVRTTMPYWGDPDGQATLDAAEQGRHYGHGLGWDREGTRARAAVGIGYPFVGEAFHAAGAASFGDSGSGIMSLEATDPTTAPARAAGIITHAVPPASLFFGTQTWMVQKTVARDRCLKVRVVPGGSFPSGPTCAVGPDVGVDKTGSFENGTARFALTVDSHGTDNATNVTLSDTLPEADGGDSGDPSWNVSGPDAAACEQSGEAGRNVSCDFGTLSPAESRDIEVRADHSGCTELNNTATVSADEDTHPSDDQDDAAIPEQDPCTEDDPVPGWHRQNISERVVGISGFNVWGAVYGNRERFDLPADTARVHFNLSFEGQGRVYIRLGRSDGDPCPSDYEMNATPARNASIVVDDPPAGEWELCHYPGPFGSTEFTDGVFTMRIAARVAG